MLVEANGPAVARLGDAWRACVGTGRTREVLHGDYRDSLAVVQREIGFGSVRAHGILHDDMGVVQPYDHRGRSGIAYAWTYVDQVVDTWLAAGLDPFLELGFMPAALGSGETTVFWWKGNITPPRDPAQWADLVRALLDHLIDRYGIERVRTWPIEVWNEPNLSSFWDGSEADYHRLYEVTARAVKQVDPGLLVGGPAVSPGADDWLPRFAAFVDSHDLPCDFVSKHAYTSGPAQHVPFGVYQTLRPPQDLLTQFATPATLLDGTVLDGLPVHITEFSSSYRPDNPIHDTAYQAAYLAPVLTADHRVDSFSYWTLCDVFEEVGVPTSILHGGFGLLAHRQLRKPVFHLYAFMARLGTEILHRGDDHIVTRRPDGGLAVLAWQPQDGSTWPRTGHRVHLDIAGLPGRVTVLERHVDAERGNVRRAWQELGCPPSPTSSQLDDLHALAAPVLLQHAATTTAGRMSCTLDLGPQGICLAEITPAPDLRPDWLDDTRLLGLGQEE